MASRQRLPTEVVGVDLHHQRTREARRDLAMTKARRLPHDQQATDELGVLPKTDPSLRARSARFAQYDKPGALR